MPVWGTCAGAIFMAKDVPGHPHPLLSAMDIRVERNAFGRQQDSFEADLEVADIGGAPYHAVFIRAPKITKTGADVETIAGTRRRHRRRGSPGQLLATSFHPESRPTTASIATSSRSAGNSAGARGHAVRRSAHQRASRAQPACAETVLASALPLPFAGGTVTGLRRMALGLVGLGGGRLRVCSSRSTAAS